MNIRGSGHAKHEPPSTIFELHQRRDIVLPAVQKEEGILGCRLGDPDLFLGTASLGIRRELSENPMVPDTWLQASGKQFEA